MALEIILMWINQYNFFLFMQSEQEEKPQEVWQHMLIGSLTMLTFCPEEEKIHGQYQELMKFLNLHQFPKLIKYLFKGMSFLKLGWQVEYMELPIMQSLP